MGVAHRSIVSGHPAAPPGRRPCRSRRRAAGPRGDDKATRPCPSGRLNRVSAPCGDARWRRPREASACHDDAEAVAKRSGRPARIDAVDLHAVSLPMSASAFMKASCAPSPRNRSQMATGRGCRCRHGNDRSATREQRLRRAAEPHLREKFQVKARIPIRIGERQESPRRAAPALLIRMSAGRNAPSGPQACRLPSPRRSAEWIGLTAQRANGRGDGIERAFIPRGQ